MRAVIQRVRSASVAVDGREVVRIGPGLLVLVGFSVRERPDAAARLAERIVALRIFNDEHGRLNRSLKEAQGDLLLIPQITLTASLTKGARPSFQAAAAPEVARGLFEALVRQVNAIYPKVSSGVFQSHMVVSLENDGPVTFVLEEG